MDGDKRRDEEEESYPQITQIRADYLRGISGRRHRAEKAAEKSKSHLSIRQIAGTTEVGYLLVIFYHL